MNPLLIATLAVLLSLTLCLMVWRLAKAGGRVRVGFNVEVTWGQK